MIRELEEELGLTTWASCLAPLTFASHGYETFHLLMPLFVCRRFDGTAAGREGQAIKWVRPRALRDLSHAAGRRTADCPSDRPVVICRPARHSRKQR